MPAAPRFFATRRSEEALHSAIHRGILAFCSAAITPSLLWKVTHEKLLINMVIRFSSRRADGTTDEFRTLFLKVASSSAPARCLCLELKERQVDKDEHLV